MRFKLITTLLTLSYGKAWANGSNTPYIEYNHWVNEGDKHPIDSSLA
jgi:hypothetical protein